MRRSHLHQSSKLYFIWETWFFGRILSVRETVSSCCTQKKEKRVKELVEKCLDECVRAKLLSLWYPDWELPVESYWRGSKSLFSTPQYTFSIINQAKSLIISIRSLILINSAYDSPSSRSMRWPYMCNRMKVDAYSVDWACDRVLEASSTVKCAVTLPLSSDIVSTIYTIGIFVYF